MRAYLAVIRDSFQEALATRVLWILLILITLFLLLLAPLGYGTTVAITVQWRDLTDPSEFAGYLVRHSDQPETPGGYLWNQLSENLRRELQNQNKKPDRGQQMRLVGRLRNEINRQLHTREFYDPEVWKAVRLGAEAAELRDRGLESLDDQQHARFNRLVLDAAFHDYIEPAGQNAIQFHYLWYPLGDEISVSEEQLHQITETVIAFVISRLVGNIGVFIALLVTASIVPQMLDAGAIDLLLSKPVSRPLLFLSKFLGGCIFILLNAAFLIIGLWLLIGIRLNLWSSGLLWTIPVFVFVFAVYYSVSTLAAVIWRNAVVSIVVSILFWATCFTVGVAKASLDEWFLDARRTVAIIPTDDSLLMVNRQGTGFEWNTSENSWVEVFRGPRRRPGGNYPFLGPVHDDSGQRLIAVRISSGARWIQATPRLLVAARDNNWKLSESINVPRGPKLLSVNGQGEIFVACTSGLYRLQGDLDEAETGLELFGMKLPGFGGQAEFVRVDNPALKWKSPFAASFDVATGEVVLRSGSQLQLLRRGDGGQYQVQSTLDGLPAGQALIGRAGTRIALASQDGLVQILDASTLQETGSYTPFGRNEPRRICSSPDGRWIAVLFHHRRLWLYDTQTDAPGSAGLPGQGDISAVEFGRNNSLYLGTGFGKIVQYDNVELMTVQDTLAQQADFLENLYQWVIDPVYTVFPKPGEMENVVSWLMTQQETVIADEDEDLSANRVVLDIQEPVWSNLAFLAVMLTLTCFLVTRRDF